MLWKSYAPYRMMRIVKGKFADNVSSTLNADRDASLVADVYSSFSFHQI